METTAPPQWRVEFRNVGRSYFPQSRVECHYSMSPLHCWASSDWIGLFKVGWSSTRDYHTFVWALSPEGYSEGTSANGCVHFQACYLPRPGEDSYQFVYVDQRGEVCARSAPFAFCAPKPLDELVTLEERREGEEEEEGEGMLLVIPRAELLQARLEECLRERAELLQAREASQRGREEDREEWDRQRRELSERLGRAREEASRLRETRQGAESAREAAAAERDALLAEVAAGRRRAGELEEAVGALGDRGREREAELDRLKERLRRLTQQQEQAVRQKGEEEEERKALQGKLLSSEEELRRMCSEFQSLRGSLAERETQALTLRDTISTLTLRLNTAQQREVENESLRQELSSLRERLCASERRVEGLGAELEVVGGQRDRGQTELHQARLEAAQLTLQLAETRLAMREGRARWQGEREALQQSAQMDRERIAELSEALQQAEARLQEEKMEREKAEVQRGEASRELQELKSSLRLGQREKEHLLHQQQASAQPLHTHSGDELLQYVRQLEQRLEAVADAKWRDAASDSNSRPDSPVSESEEDSPEALQPPHPLGAYSLCDPPTFTTEALLLATPPPSPQGGVVISQPAPLSSPRQQDSESLAHSSESEPEDEKESALYGAQSSGDETALLLPEHSCPAEGQRSGSPLWN
ncbi:calcium-binding and coiled-coil domain-containing protein 1 isoform X2 [Lepisosteus oculatus]|uniref:calcium-binding and coiled-coil domain-containing protein 1 isoform X2 n=1 Tax=Lepisosteus oculatus TaxID=7918 RepID=UPI0035F52136